MPRLLKSLDVLLSEFNAFKASLAPNSFNLQKLNAYFYTCRCALRRLKENGQVKEDSNTERSEFEQTVCDTKSNHSNHESLQQLDIRIKQKMKAKARERLFLIVADMFAGLKVESSSFDDFMEAAHCDHFSSHLQQVLGQNDKMFCCDSAMETLDEALDYRDGCVDCSNIMHYNLLKDKFNSSITLEHLHRILCERLTDFFDKIVPKHEEMHIFQTDGFGYTYGVGHDILEERTLSLPEHMCVLDLNGQLSNELSHTFPAISWRPHESAAR